MRLYGFYTLHTYSHVMSGIYNEGAVYIISLFKNSYNKYWTITSVNMGSLICIIILTVYRTDQSNDELVIFSYVPGQSEQNTVFHELDNSPAVFSAESPPSELER